MGRKEDIDARIMNAILDNPLITQQKLSENAKITRETCRKHLASLTQAGAIRGRGYIVASSKEQLSGYILVKSASDAASRSAVEVLITSSRPIIAEFHLITGDKYDYMLHITRSFRDGEVGKLIRELRAIGSTVTETLAIVGAD